MGFGGFPPSLVFYYAADQLSIVASGVAGDSPGLSPPVRSSWAKLGLEPLSSTPNAGMLRKTVEQGLCPWLTEPAWFPLGGEGL